MDYRPIFFLFLSLFGAVGAWLATLAGWFLLYSWLWTPYWRELQRLNMYVHDIEGGYIVAYGPFLVAVLFFFSSLSSLIAVTVARIQRMGP